MENQITVIIPTYNRPERINYFVENCLKNYTGTIFLFEIHDSSSSEETKKIIEKFNLEYNRQVSYHKYDSSICGENKTHQAVSNVQTKFIYLMGDAIATDFNKLEEFLSINKYFEYDLFGIIPTSFRFNKAMKKKYIEDTIYDDFKANQFFSDFLYAFTLYGSNVISKKLLDYINKNGIYDKFNEGMTYEAAQVSSWSHQLAILEGINFNNYKYCISFISFFRYNPIKTGSWQYGENWWNIFGVGLQTSIDKIDAYSENDKNQALKIYGEYVYNKEHIMSLKIHKAITPKYMKKYKKYILRCNDHYKFMWLIAFTPRFIIISFKGIAKVFKSFFKKKAN